MKAIKLIPILCLLAINIQAAPTAKSTAVITNSPNSQVQTLVTLNSHHHYEVTNDTPKSKLFYFKVSLCPANQMGRCARFADHVALAKGQHYSHDMDLESKVVFQGVGDKSIVAETEITGGAPSYSLDQKYLWVHY